MQHQKTIHDGKWENSGISEHGKNCYGQISWNNIEMLKLQNNQFQQKTRESLEIQKYNSKNEAMNFDPGSHNVLENQ